MKRLPAWQLGLLALVLAPAALRAQDENARIDYGGGIGRVRLGQKDSEVEAILGEPTSSEAAAGTETEVWRATKKDGQSEQTVVVFTHDKKKPLWKAAEVIVTSAFFHTKGGVTVRSDPAAVWREFPDLRYAGEGNASDGARLEMYDARSIGIAFLFQRNTSTAGGASWGTCRGILVHRVDQEPTFSPVGAPTGPVTHG